MPEPERKLVLLPTTSEWFLWNRVSEALGDDAGSVVLSGLGPQMFAPAELKMLSESSRIARENQRRRLAEQELTPLDANQSFSQVAMRR
jgi:hypothetical protein